MTQTPNGYVFYSGPSVIDGQPIVAIATGLGKKSQNRKTGALIQTYIIRADMHPINAVNIGADYSICGGCPHRGTVIDGKVKGRSCYVTLAHGPAAVYRTLQAGKYPSATLDQMRDILALTKVRMGTYGDPAAVPFKVWETILEATIGHTGYTHQWRDYPQLSRYVMASADSAVEREEAKALGFRTFRVRAKQEEKLQGEGICPASEEAGKVTTCASCLLCGGHKGKGKADIVIIAHGMGKVHFEKGKAA